MEAQDLNATESRRHKLGQEIQRAQVSSIESISMETKRRSKGNCGNLNSIVVKTTEPFLGTNGDGIHVFALRLTFESVGQTSEFRGVVLARGGPSKCRVARITHDRSAKNSDEIVGRDGGNSPAGHA